MKGDRVAEHNRRMWERLAKAGIPYTRPQGRLPRTRAGLRRFLDPHGRLRGVRLQSARVLALASGGGWDAPTFAKLGAETTLFDISRRQLQTVRVLARRARVRIRIVQGNMKDLSVFGDGSFDVVWHSHSLVFVDDAAAVLRGVGRILTPRGVYVMSTVHPTTMRLYGGWTGSGWQPRRTYFDEGPIPPDPDWAWEFEGKRVIAPTIEYGHRFDTIINAMVAGGLVVDGLWELRPEALEPKRRGGKKVVPGSDADLHRLFPAYIQVRGRKPPL